VTSKHGFLTIVATDHQGEFLDNHEY